MSGRPWLEGRAPGRLDVMGGIADYSGSLVLELPLHEEVRASIQREESGTLTLESRRCSGESSRFTMPLADLDRTYDEARAYFQHGWPWWFYAGGTPR